MIAGWPSLVGFFGFCSPSANSPASFLHSVSFFRLLQHRFQNSKFPKSSSSSKIFLILTPSFPLLRSRYPTVFVPVPVSVPASFSVLPRPPFPFLSSSSPPSCLRSRCLLLSFPAFFFLLLARCMCKYMADPLPLSPFIYGYCFLDVEN